MNYFNENWLVLPRNYFQNRIHRHQLFATYIFNRWQMVLEVANLQLATVNFEPCE